jgi:predicted MFS family arabinose efflux permease
MYAGFALFDTPVALISLFLAFGLYFGFSEPAERALVADLAPPHLCGTAFGLFHAVVGIGALPASALFGLVWSRWGAPTAFLFGSALAFLASALLIMVRRRT